jgi:hypothetical protein
MKKDFDDEDKDPIGALYGMVVCLISVAFVLAIGWWLWTLHHAKSVPH